mmetsp:Transcript_16046/g.52269  ORF Transcript_16046/g.52269 Transcript_16046/m.52269 type:complete len:274 (+) Transcript_16046:434-1255(+)
MVRYRRAYPSAHVLASLSRSLACQSPHGGRPPSHPNNATERWCVPRHALTPSAHASNARASAVHSSRTAASCAGGISRSTARSARISRSTVVTNGGASAADPFRFPPELDGASPPTPLRTPGCWLAATQSSQFASNTSMACTYKCIASASLIIPSRFHASYLALASAESHIPGRGLSHGPSVACVCRASNRMRSASLRLGSGGPWTPYCTARWNFSGYDTAASCAADSCRGSSCDGAAAHDDPASSGAARPPGMASPAACKANCRFMANMCEK